MEYDFERYARQDPWPGVPFFDPEQKAREELADACVWAVCTVAFFGLMFGFLGG